MNSFALILCQVRDFLRDSGTNASLADMTTDEIENLTQRMAGTKAMLELVDSIHELHGRHMEAMLRSATVGPNDGTACANAAMQTVSLFINYEKNLYHERLTSRWDRLEKAYAEETKRYEDETRDHARMLAVARKGRKAIAKQLGISETSVNRLLTSRR